MRNLKPHFCSTLIDLMLSTAALTKIGRSRLKISDGQREKVWLRVRGRGYHKLGIGTASRSLNRLARPAFALLQQLPSNLCNLTVASLIPSLCPCQKFL
jgi:hypothetical protein